MGLNYLHREWDMELFYLLPRQILLVSETEVKITDYGRFQLTEVSLQLLNDVSFEDVIFLPPEFFLNVSLRSESSTYSNKGEIWALGMILLKALSILKAKNSLDLYFSENRSKMNYAKEITRLTFKYKAGQLFQKYPFVFEYESLIEKFLTGCEFEGISIEMRDFLSKCLELNPNHRFSAYDLLRHPWFNSKAFKNRPKYVHTPKILSSIYEQKFIRDQRLALDSLFSECELDPKSDFLWIFFGMKDLVDLMLILDENQEEKLILAELVKRSENLENLPFCLQSADSQGQSEKEKKGKNLMFYQRFINFPIANLLKLLRFELGKFLSFKKANNSKDFALIFAQNIRNLARNFTGYLAEETTQRNQSDVVSEKEMKTENLGQRILSKVGFGSRISRLFTSNVSSKSNEEEKNQSNKVSQDASLVRFSSKVQVHIFYAFYIHSLSSQKKIGSIFTLLYHLPLPVSHRLGLWRKLLEVEYDTSLIYSFTTIDNNIYPSKSKLFSQIESDIPRCHQYHPFFNTYEGKLRLYELIVNLMNTEKNMVYIQGMDAMAAVALEASGFKIDIACVLLGKIIDKTIKNFLRHSEEKNYVKEELLVFQWLLFFLEPALAKHLQEIGFLPELYAVSWILNLFSMIFQIEKVMRIWDLILCNSHYTLLFAISIMCDLKSKLQIMNLNECMSCIRNLEGIIDFSACIFYSGEVLEPLPGSFFTVNSLKNKEDIQDYENQFYKDRPWEIPSEVALLEKRILPYISVFDLMNLNCETILIDIRSIQEFEEKHINNSLNMPFTNAQVQDIYVEFLEAKSQSFLSFEKIEISDDSQICQKVPGAIMKFIVLIGNSDMKNQESVGTLLVGKGIKHICILNGGIQSVGLDAPELLKYKGKSTPLAYFRKKNENT